MYKILDWDPWSWWSVSSVNAQRTTAHIKQHTRWGVNDIVFLACYYGRCKIIGAEVKKFKPRGASLSNGEELEDIDFVIKILGFTGDFKIDQINKTKEHIGPYPNGDYRRWINCGGSSIDANNFAGLGFLQGITAECNNSIWFHQHPYDAKRAVEDDRMFHNPPRPEMGLPAFHLGMRECMMSMMILCQYAPEVCSYGEWEAKFKAKVVMKLAPPKVWIENLKADWEKYCKMFADNGDTIDPPPYPYTAEMLNKWLDREDEIEDEENDRMVRFLARQKKHQEQAEKQEE